VLCLCTDGWLSLSMSQEQPPICLCYWADAAAVIISIVASLSLYVLGVGRFSYCPPPCLGMYRWMHLSLGCMSFECRITMPPLAWLIFSLQHLNQPSHSTATDWLTDWML
jgi:hypothetical protein